MRIALKLAATGFLASALSCTPSASSATSSPVQPDSGTFERHRHASSGRTYRLYVPSGISGNEPRPLIVAVHGCLESPESFAGGTGFNELAARRRAFVLYPRQPQTENPQRCWNWYEPQNQRRSGPEPAAIAGMIDEVSGEHPVDRNRIFATGISSGGAMVAILAACYPDVFSAVGIASGVGFGFADSKQSGVQAMQNGSQIDLTKAAQRAYRCSEPNRFTIPVAVFHGSDDSVVNPTNAGDIARQFFMVNDLGRDGELNGTRLPDAAVDRTISRGEGHDYRYRRYDGKNVGPVVHRYDVKGMGHAWSGGDETYPFNDAKGPDATQILWEFFQGTGL